MTPSNVTALPLHEEWWVIQTPEGHRPVDYRPNSQAGVVGPFSSRMTADAKAAELTLKATARRHIRRCIVLTVVATAFTVGLTGFLAVAS